MGEVGTYGIDCPLQALADEAIRKAEVCIAGILDCWVCQTISNCHALQIERLGSCLHCTVPAQQVLQWVTSYARASDGSLPCCFHKLQLSQLAHSVLHIM